VVIYILSGVLAQRGYVQQAGYTVVLFTILVLFAYLLFSPDPILIYCSRTLVKAMHFQCKTFSCTFCLRW